MGSGSKIVVFGTVIIVAFILQIVLIGADRHETPGTVAVDFSKAYFKLDADMADLLCSEMTEDDDVDVVDDYLNRVEVEARAEGFDPSWRKMALAHIELETEMVDENTAEIQITCERRRSINPVFGAVAKIFFLGDTYKVEETLTVVKEDDGWKVCGRPFSLIES
ncbi:MAG: hypothetical protein IMF02_08975 [Proteobacteria bacterium]|nr:hypothetical protein [Pseudomonadota bacterium]